MIVWFVTKCVMLCCLEQRINFEGILWARVQGKLAAVIWNWETIRWPVARVCECKVTFDHQSGQQRAEITKTFPIVCERVFGITILFFELP